MQAAMIVLAVLCIGLTLRLYAQKSNLRAGAEQLRQRRQEGGGAPLHLAAPDKASEELLSEINALLKLREDDQAAFRNREKTIRQQVANVSHDLRTPLTSILGYLQLLEDGSLTEAQRRSYLEVVEGRAKALQSLIISFYDLSRLEAGEYPIVREQVDLREVICQLLAAFYDELEAHFQVEVALPEDLPLVWGDQAALSRVYTNLLRNALEHGSGTLSIQARRTEAGVETCFTNGGAELTQEQLPHVFDRFFTSDQTRSGRNTGLGLAIVKVLTDQMGGSAKADLRDGKFSVALCWRSESSGPGRRKLENISKKEEAE